MKSSMTMPVLFAIFSIAVLSSCGVKNHPPRPDHIVIVIEENHGYNQVIGTGNAPYINQLAKEGALFTNSHGVTHPSQPNYVAFFSGGLQGIKGDECLKDSTPYTTPNLGASLIKAGYTFAGYSETLPGEGFLECSYEQVKGYSYARKHAPWVNWQGNKENGLPASTNLPLSSFPSDFDSLPTLSFVIPNQGNDMHNTWIDGDTAAIQRADRWLKDHLSRYVDWAKTHNSLLILTFDEDDFTPDNHIPTLFVGPMVQPGEYADSINHYSVLRTLEAMYGLPPAGAAQAAVIRNVWQ